MEHKRNTQPGYHGFGFFAIDKIPYGCVGKTFLFKHNFALPKNSSFRLCRARQQEGMKSAFSRSLHSQRAKKVGKTRRFSFERKVLFCVARITCR